MKQKNTYRIIIIRVVVTLVSTVIIRKMRAIVIQNGDGADFDNIIGAIYRYDIGKNRKNN